MKSRFSLPKNQLIHVDRVKGQEVKVGQVGCVF